MNTLEGILRALAPTRATVSRALRLGMVVLVSPVISGCVAPLAASYALSGAAVGWTGWSIYDISREPGVTFRVERAEPDQSGREQIRRAKSIAIIPSADGTDGGVVDVARRDTNLRVVSASTVAQWLRANRVDFGMLSSSERTETMARLGRAVGADLVIMVESKGQSTSGVGLSMLIPGSLKIDHLFETTMVSTQARRIVWQEKHAISVDGIANVSVQKMTDLLATGIAKRVSEMRQV